MLPRIRSVEAFPISLPRDLTAALGTAGSPSRLAGTAGGSGPGAYEWSRSVPAVYSSRFETTLVRIQLHNGLTGWGEAQAPVAPGVSAEIVNGLLAGLLRDREFDGSTGSVESIYGLLYQSMRVRGQTGGFMLDAIAGVDIALWDLAGKLQGKPVADILLPGSHGRAVPAYVSGLPGESTASKVAYARARLAEGFRVFKIFFDGDEEQTLELLEALGSELAPAGARFAVDALWRLEWPASRGFLERLALHNLLWIEAPFMPDEPSQHRDFAGAMPHLPMALGESYRTWREMEWFLGEGLVRYVQPDLGRCGITGTLQIAKRAPDVLVAPHVSIALGPQIAAAIHASAAIPQAPFCEYNPAVLEMANRWLTQPLQVDGEFGYRMSGGVGLGIDLRPVTTDDDGPPVKNLAAAPALETGE